MYNVRQSLWRFRRPDRCDEPVTEWSVFSVKWSQTTRCIPNEMTESIRVVDDVSTINQLFHWEICNQIIYKGSFFLMWVPHIVTFVSVCLPRVANKISSREHRQRRDRYIWLKYFSASRVDSWEMNSFRREDQCKHPIISTIWSDINTGSRKIDQDKHCLIIHFYHEYINAAPLSMDI